MVNTDVLEHVPEGELHHVISGMASLSKCCFISISTRYADQLLSDGSNAHCTVRPKDWWEALLKEHFHHVQEIEIGVPDSCTFVTWPVASEASEHINKVVREGKWSRNLKRRRSRISAWLKEKTNFLATLSDLHDDIEGKTVAVVGNARSLAQTNRGDEIDSHDWVIRFNRAPIPSVRSHGVKTDWLATGMPLDTDFKRRRGAKRILWLSPHRKYMTKSMLHDRSTYMVDRGYYSQIKETVEQTPSSGFVILDMLSKSNCKNVDIYGFDFFMSKSLSCHQEGGDTQHDFSSEKRLVEALCARDSRFKIVGAKKRN